MNPTLLLFVLMPDVGPTRTVDFATEIVPVLTSAGCNAGACHGAAAGRGGFRLSLLGGDPAADYESIVYELEGRRVNFPRPDESLVLLKPTGKRTHQGGERLTSDGPGAKRLRAWIAAGAPASSGRRLVRLDVAPLRQIVLRAGTDVPLRATAHFDDGQTTDVTDVTVFTTSDSAAVEVDVERARATVLRPGQHVVTARFLDRVIPLQLILPLSDQSVDLSRERRANFVDEEILKVLEILRLPVSPRVDDAGFLRRLRLDLTGRVPSPEETENFLREKAPERRAKLVDRLLESPDFVDYWTYRLALLLRVRSTPADREGARAFHQWLRTQVQRRTPLDEVARSLLTAVGDSHVIGPANFTRAVPDARNHAELVSQVFLGARLQCANCHNHPLDRWTQDDYHGLAAIFARLERGREVRLVARGAVTNPRTGEPAVPRLPGVRYLAPDADGRVALAQWLTAQDNPLFARAFVNRLWRALFGRGLVDPVDDLRETNPATHPELLNRLATHFVEHGYDLRATLRLLVLSESYGRGGATVANQADDRFYSHALVRPLEPEILADAIADISGLWDRYGEEPPGTRAIALVDARIPSVSLDILGRCSRQMSCEGATQTGGLPAKLHQINGELVNRKVSAREGRLHRLVAAGASDEAILAEFALRTLGRPLRSAEREFFLKGRKEGNPAERTAWLEDVVWSLLNCREFVTNH